MTSPSGARLAQGPRDHVRWRAASAVLLLCFGCRGQKPESETEAVARAPVPASEAVVPARFVNSLAFVGTAAESPRLYLRFLNRTSSSQLVRDYRGWLAEGNGWSRVLALRDTLPLPRAAWRVLPAAGLRVRVGDGADLAEIAISDSGQALRLTLGGPIAEWSGATGQREYLGLAALEREGVRRPGLLFVRRGARATSAPRPRDADRLIVLADTLGNGLLIAKSTSDSTASAAAWTWMDGVEESWTDVTFSPLASPGAPSEGEWEWTVEIGDADLSGHLERREALGARAGAPLETVFLVWARISVRGRVRRMSGVGLISPLP